MTRTKFLAIFTILNVVTSLEFEEDYYAPTLMIQVKLITQTITIVIKRAQIFLWYGFQFGNFKPNIYSSSLDYHLEYDFYVIKIR